MSALASILPQDAICTGIINNWARVRPSFVRGLPSHLDFIPYVCFMGILDATIGHNRTWGKFSWSYFQKISNCSRRWCEQAICTLLGENEEDPDTFTCPLIQRRKAITGGYEYRIVARPEGDVSGIAKCRDCGQVGEVDLDPEFIPVPHSFFSLPAACTPTEFLLVTAIMARTQRWGKVSKQIEVTPCQISIEEFQRATGKGRSEIIESLKRIEEAGFIGSKPEGRTNWYWTRPENFAKRILRAARKVKQPVEKRKKVETDNSPKQIQPVEPKQPIRPAEFVTAPCGVCRNCHTYGPMDIVSVVEKKPVEQARAGPKQKTAYQKAQDDAFEKIMGVKRA
jgi:hypothetical protein